MSHPRLIVAAALKTKEGFLIVGARHMDGIMRATMAKLNIKPSDIPRANHGFIDNFGVWVDRVEALEIATSQKQLRFIKVNPINKLFSEDLY